MNFCDVIDCHYLDHSPVDGVEISDDQKRSVPHQFFSGYEPSVRAMTLSVCVMPGMKV
jgi:hypothetical protein